MISEPTRQRPQKRVADVMKRQVLTVHPKTSTGRALEIMSPSVEIVSPDTPLFQAAKRLSSSERHHLVVEENGALIGFLSAWDIVASISVSPG